MILEFVSALISYIILPIMVSSNMRFYILSVMFSLVVLNFSMMHLYKNQSFPFFLKSIIYTIIQ